MENNHEQAALAYTKKIHRMGRITSLLLLLGMIGVAIVLGLWYDIKFDMGAVTTASIAILSFMVPASMIEFLSYAPIIGAGGQYVAFITGNIVNMKLPSAVSSIKLSGYKEGSEEADVISTISISVSSLVTMGVLVIGMALGAAMLPVLQHPTLTPAFNNLMPAVLGALAFPFFAKNPKGSIGPCMLGILLVLILGLDWVTANSTYLIPVFLLVAVGWSYLLYKKEKNEKSET